jgi:hypothetical protein
LECLGGASEVMEGLYSVLDIGLCESYCCGQLKHFGLR